MLIKKAKKLLILLPIILFAAAYASVPDKITLISGQNSDFRCGIAARASSSEDSKFVKAKLLNLIPIKTVEVSVMPQISVIPSGETIGVKIHTDGILVVGISDIAPGVPSPAKKAGILTGDRIVSVNGEKVSSASAFSRQINAAKGTAHLSVIRGEESFSVNLRAAYCEDSKSYKAGLWVRDSAAGIGTLTFYNPENSTFAALGHAICDSDTKDPLVLRRGSITSCRIRSVQKGEKGIPGELSGDFIGGEIGEITENSALGIYGKAEKLPSDKGVIVASRFEIKEGDAQILCDVDGNGVMSYEIEITKISKSERVSNKSFAVRVTDENLLEKTGGIVQGMSGSPILQDGKLVGAVTHVFVNDPKRGYGVFAENMLDKTLSVN